MKKIFILFIIAIISINAASCSKNSGKRIRVVTVADVGGNPDGVTVADSGNIYITDIGNGDVKLITEDGEVTTIANTGENTHPDGITSVTTDTGKEILYVTDTGSNEPVNETLSTDGSIKRVDTETGVVTTVVDSSVVDNPTGIAADNSGNLYVADQSTGDVYIIPVDTTGNVGTPVNLTETLPAEVDIEEPHGLTLVNGDDNAVILYVTDQGAGDNNVVKIEIPDTSNPSTVTVSEFTSESSGGTDTDTTASEAEFNSPHGLSLDADNNIIISDENNNRVQIITASEEVLTVAGSGTPGDLDSDTETAQFNQPRGLAVDNEGNVLVCDYGNGKVKKIIPDEEPAVTTVADVGGNPAGLTVADSGNIYVTDIDSGEVKQIAPDGIVTVVADTDTTTIAEHPDGITAVTTTGGEDVIYVTSTGTADPDSTTLSTDGVIKKIDVGTGTVTTFVDNNVIENPTGIAADESGNLYVADKGTGDVYKIPVDEDGNAGTPVNLTDTLPAGVDIENPHGITLETHEDQSITLYVTDQGDNSNNIVKIDIADSVSTSVTEISEITPDSIGGSSTYTNVDDARFNDPNSLSAGKNGAIFVTDENNNKVQVITPSGNVITIAGDGNEGDANGEKNEAQFNNPNGIAVNNNGDIVVCDSGNGKIKLVKNGK